MYNWRAAIDRWQTTQVYGIAIRIAGAVYDGVLASTSITDAKIPV